MPSVRSAHKELPACLANLSPMMMSGFLLPVCQATTRQCVGAAAGCDLLMLRLKTKSKDRSLRQLLRGIRFQASAFSSASMSCKTFDSPFSPQYRAIICLSASTL
ncbi:hypothetical protein F7R14_27700 [Pseudomonas lini]|uniref:Uncharacterized protein n=1 Tax=Pseudomonas lini TaxID=163011 RepID=A0A7V7NZL2_9PSED|nr:hypothetical protein F7R14_27700 [Pseudomonas lini]MDT9678076.1 hypothetical protein [Pseudomonas sp. JV414]